MTFDPVQFATAGHFEVNPEILALYHGGLIAEPEDAQ